MADRLLNWLAQLVKKRAKVKVKLKSFKFLAKKEKEKWRKKLFGHVL